MQRLRNALGGDATQSRATRGEAGTPVLPGLVPSWGRVATTFTWDAADRLAVHKLADGTILTHTYRFDNLRYARQGPNGTDGQMWDGSALVGWSRKDASGSTDGQPAQAFSGASDGPDVGRALGTQTGTGTVGVQRQYHTDDQGNELAISDDSQATAVSYDIGAFGDVRSGSAADQPLDFVGGQGYQRDADAGTLYVRARHYDPATGEWLSQDPIEGEPAYGYGYNAPTAFTDASGMQGTFDVILPGQFMDVHSEEGRKYRKYQDDKARWLLDNPPKDLQDWKIGKYGGIWSLLTDWAKVDIWATRGRGKDLFRVVPADPRQASMRAVQPGERFAPVSRKSISQMGDMEKIREAICRATPALPAAVADQVLGMVRDGRTWAAIGVCLAAWGFGHYFGYGELIDLGLITYAWVQIGEGAIVGAEELVDFVAAARSAKSDADLKIASDHFANAVGILTVDGVAILLTRGTPKAARADIKAITTRVRARRIKGIRGKPDLPPLKPTAAALREMHEQTRGGVKRSAEIDAMNAVAVARARSVMLGCLREAHQMVTRRIREGGYGLIEWHGDFGNMLHVLFDDAIKRRGLPNLRSEVSYTVGRETSRFVHPSVRLDVAIYERFGSAEGQVVALRAVSNPSRPALMEVYELRTGRRIGSYDTAEQAKVRHHLPTGSEKATMHELNTWEWARPIPKPPVSPYRGPNGG